MNSKKILIGILLLVLALTLAACTGNNEKTDTKVNDKEMNMDHSVSAEIPADLKEEENPKYKVGSKVIIETSHMDGMKGAEAIIVGAFDTNAYAISYTPTNGERKVENHKWLIQQEIVDAGDKLLKPGTEVKIMASHMEGMYGAAAKIDSAEPTTVYMVNYKPTTGGKAVENHKWLTENEIKAK